MQLTTNLMYFGDARVTADQAIALEKAGIDVAWIAEVYGFDAVSLLGYIAAKTETMHLGTGILPIYSRTPALIAQTAAGLDSVSNGRAILGLGASGPQVVEGWHGVAYDKPLGRTREIVDLCRRAWRREKLENDGIYQLPYPGGTGLGKPLKMLTHPVRPNIPIFLAALGDKNVELAAEIAEGWLPMFFVPEKVDEVWGPSLAAGKAKRDASLAPLQINAGGLLAIGEDAGQLANSSRGFIALYLGGMGAKGKNFYNDLAVRCGWGKEAAEVQELYLAGKKMEAAAAVPQEMVDLTNLCGPESWVKERVQAFKDVGVTHLSVLPCGPNGNADIATVKEWLA